MISRGLHGFIKAMMAAGAALCLLNGCAGKDGFRHTDYSVQDEDAYDLDNPGADETILFRLAETMPEDHPSARTMADFARLVEAESGGKIKIRVYYDGELGAPQEILKQMKFGGIALARVNSLELSDAIPPIRPYLDPDRYMGPGGQIEWFHASEDILRNTCQLEKITPLTWYYPDLRCIFSSSHPIEGRKDLEGARVKTTECLVMKELMETMGAEMVGISSTDLYRSLSSGDVQYGESGFCEFICRDFGKYIHYARITDYAYFPDVLLINTDSFNSLDPDEKRILEECAQKTYEYQKQQMLSFKEHWISQLEQDGKVDFAEGGFH